MRAPIDVEAPTSRHWRKPFQPHPTESADRKPDDAALFDLLAGRVPDKAERQRVLVQNPAELCRFP